MFGGVLSLGAAIVGHVWTSHVWEPEVELGVAMILCWGAVPAVSVGILSSGAASWLASRRGVRDTVAVLTGAVTGLILGALVLLLVPLTR